MEKKGLLVVCAVVSVLISLVTVILGIIGAASAAQAPAVGVGCGVMAGLLALTTQIVATAATGCCGCCQTWGIPSESKRIVAVVLSTVSWLLAIIVVILFFAGALVSIFEDDGAGVFVAATIMFIIAVVFQITSYILLQETTEKLPLVQEQGIAMAQPVQPKAPLNADQQAAAGGDPPHSAPPVTSEVGVVDPPPATTDSSKASAPADPTSQV